MNSTAKSTHVLASKMKKNRKAKHTMTVGLRVVERYQFHRVTNNIRISCLVESDMQTNGTERPYGQLLNCQEPHGNLELTFFFGFEMERRGPYGDEPEGGNDYTTGCIRFVAGRHLGLGNE